MVDDGGAHGLVRSLRRDAGQEGGDRLGADDRFECGPDDAATIGGEDGIRIEDAQQPFQISGRRGLGEGVDDTAVHRGIDRESWLAESMWVASARGQFRQAAGFRPSAVPISVNESPNRSCRTNAARSAGASVSRTTSIAHEMESARLTASAGSVPSPPAPAARGDIALTPAPRRAQHVQSEAGGRGDQPSGEVVDLVEVAALQAGSMASWTTSSPRSHAAEQPVGHADQAWPQASNSDATDMSAPLTGV